METKASLPVACHLSIQGATGWKLHSHACNGQIVGLKGLVQEAEPERESHH